MRAKERGFSCGSGTMQGYMMKGSDYREEGCVSVFSPVIHGAGELWEKISLPSWSDSQVGKALQCQKMLYKAVNWFWMKALERGTQRENGATRLRTRFPFSFCRLLVQASEL